VGVLTLRNFAGTKFTQGEPFLLALICIPPSVLVHHDAVAKAVFVVWLGILPVVRKVGASVYPFVQTLVTDLMIANPEILLCCRVEELLFHSRKIIHVIESC
jgi:hypothetical protein